VVRGITVGNGIDLYQVKFDPNGHKLTGVALVYLAWREVLEDSRTALRGRPLRLDLRPQ
jgi:hypothetical protein